MLALTGVLVFCAPGRSEFGYEQLPAGRFLHEAGIKVMGEEFPGLNEIYTIRAAANELTKNQKPTLKQEIGSALNGDSTGKKPGVADDTKEGRACLYSRPFCTI